MGASILSLVTLTITACCLLTAVVVKAQGPSSIVVSPATLTVNGQYTVSWQDDIASCFIAGVYLVEAEPTLLKTSTVQTLLPSASCNAKGNFVECTSIAVDSFVHLATGIAGLNLDPSKVYQVNVLWASTSGAGPLQVLTTSQPVRVTTTDIDSLSSTTPSSSANNAAPPLSSNISGHSLTTTAATSTSGIGSLSTTPAAAPTTTSSATSIPVTPGNVSDSSSLSTGAKVGIAIGVVGFALLALIAVLLLWRRGRQRRLRALPNGMPYSHDTGSPNRDFTAEKEMHVISSPVDTLHNGYTSIPHAAGAAGEAAVVPYTDAQRHSHASGYEDSTSPTRDSQSHMPPSTATAAATGAAIQRKPVGATSGPTTHHLREPGMSDDEVARLEEEERRLDEAIAEAERRRQTRE